MFGFAPSVRYTTPGRPSPCPRHDNEAFGSYATSALPPAHGHCRVLPWRCKRCGSAPVPTPETRAPRSGLLDAGRMGHNACQRSDVTGPPPCHVGSGVCHPPCTPPVSRRCQQRFLASASVAGRERSATRGWASATLFFTGFGPQRLPTSDARCIVLIPLCMYGALREPSLAPLKGAPERPR